MGRGMASNLQNKGFALTVFDLQEAPLLELEKLGAKRARSFAELVQSSDVILTVLPGSPEVEAAVLGSEGILAHGRPGLLLMDLSTVDPVTTDKLSAALAGWERN